MVGPPQPPVLLPFQRFQHSRLATWVQHVLGSGRVRPHNPWLDGSQPPYSFLCIQWVVESDESSQDAECIKYRSLLKGEYKWDMLSGVVSYREQDVCLGFF